MRIKAIISYKGTNFYGFQVQKDESLRSVQAEIEKVLEHIFSSSIRIHASGRTDRGVHALGQVIHFDATLDNISLYKLRYSLNCLLPNDIHVISLEEVSEEFHSRYSALSKEYRYIISLNEVSPFNNDLVYTYSFTKPLDLEKMKEGMKLFIGEHDFHNFCTNDEDFIRTIISFNMEEKDNTLIFDIKGNGFRRYMVRMIMGAIIALGQNKITLEEISYLLNTPNMERIRYKAPSEGLYLVRVNYEGDLND